MQTEKNNLTWQKYLRNLGKSQRNKNNMTQSFIAHCGQSSAQTLVVTNLRLLLFFAFRMHSARLYSVHYHVFIFLPTSSLSTSPLFSPSHLSF